MKDKGLAGLTEETGSVALTADLEGVTDAPQNSVFALLSGLFAIVGMFAILAPTLVGFSIAAILCGLLVLLIARSWEISTLSIRASTLAILLSLFTGLAGVTYYRMREFQTNKKAIEVATYYMEALAHGDRATAIKMVGLPQLVEQTDGEDEKQSREQQAVRLFLADPAIREVLQRGLEASWKSTGIVSKFLAGGMVEIGVAMVDSNQVNQRPYIVRVKLQPPNKYTVETRNQWFIDGFDQAPL